MEDVLVVAAELRHDIVLSILHAADRALFIRFILHAHLIEGTVLDPAQAAHDVLEGGSLAALFHSS